MTNKEAKEKLYMEWQEFLENNIDYAGVSEAYKMAFKALDTWDKIFTSYDNLVAKIESKDDISHATERIDEWCIEQLRGVIGDYYADRIIKEHETDPYQTDMDEAWEQAKTEVEPQESEK